MTRRVILLGIACFVGGVCFEAGRIHATAAGKTWKAAIGALASQMEHRRVAH